MFYIFLLAGVIILGALLIAAIILQRRGENAKAKSKYVMHSYGTTEHDFVKVEMDPYGVMVATKKARGVHTEQPERTGDK